MICLPTLAYFYRDHNFDKLLTLFVIITSFTYLKIWNQSSISLTFLQIFHLVSILTPLLEYKQKAVAVDNAM